MGERGLEQSFRREEREARSVRGRDSSEFKARRDPYTCSQEIVKTLNTKITKAVLLLSQLILKVEYYINSMHGFINPRFEFNDMQSGGAAVVQNLL